MQLNDAVITGIGLVSPLGLNPGEVLTAISEGRSARRPPAEFDPSGFDCPYAGEVDDPRLRSLVRDRKAARFMGRDAFLAVAAAQLAMDSAALVVGRDAQPEEIGLFGATGIAGLPFREIEPLVRNSSNEHGGLDLQGFGREGLRQTRPVTSFQILSNMPICFVSISENIRGPNLVFNPWEGQGALAILEAARHLHQGTLPLALVGGCDYKCHNLAFVTLQQHGLFESWKTTGQGLFPGEGAAFFLLESPEHASKRKARIFSVLRGAGQASDLSSLNGPTANCPPLAEAMSSALGKGQDLPDCLFAACDGDAVGDASEADALKQLELHRVPSVSPKRHVGNLFAASAAMNVALASFFLSAREESPLRLAEKSCRTALVNCFGPGTEKVSFLLEAS